MAVLPAGARTGISRAIQRRWSDLRESCGFTKAQLAAAVDAADAWADANDASFVAALPTQFRNNSTATQKTLLFLYVVGRRAGLLEWSDGS